MLNSPTRSAPPARLRHLPAQHYQASPHWQLLQAALEPVVRTVAEAAGTAAVAEATTRALLNLLGWRGTIVHSTNGKPELFISAAGENNSTGAVWILPGGTNGPTSKGSSMITASSAGLPKE